MKVIQLPAMDRSEVSVLRPKSCSTPDNRLENAELVCAFRNLADTVSGVSDYSSPYLPPTPPLQPTELDHAVDEDFQVFQDIAVQVLQSQTIPTTGTGVRGARKKVNFKKHSQISPVPD
jgi:hypothetical protein